MSLVNSGWQLSEAGGRKRSAVDPAAGGLGRAPTNIFLKKQWRKTHDTTCFATVLACARRRSGRHRPARRQRAGALARKLGTQTPYWHRFVLGAAEVTAVADGPLPLGPPKGTFIGVPDAEGR